MSGDRAIPTDARPMAAESSSAEPERELAINSPRPAHSIEDKRLLEDLYRQYANELRRYLGKILGSGPPDPDDICHEAFRRLAEAKNLREIKSLNGFLWRTAQNAIVSEQRRAAVRLKHTLNVEHTFYPEKGDGFSPERVLLARSELVAIQGALETMDAKRREVLIMSRFDGLSLAEIARRLGVARATVSKRLAQAMLELDAAVEGPKE
ncbi:MAG: RNA polymerase sigma factor [Pseudomonadota bacterium]